MSAIAPSELIITNRGSVYHIDCRPEEIANTVLTVGDPDRVSAVSKHFDTIEYKNQHREFITHTGTIGGKRLTVISTGIGPDNIDIVMNELDALVNIDLETRKVKEELTSLNIIRLGTSGALQADIAVDSFVASAGAIGLDNLLNYYKLENNEEEKQIMQAFNIHTQVNSVTTPYMAMASMKLLKEFTDGYHHGITITCPGFYGPQGRVLRMPLALPHLINSLTDFSYGNHRITNFEMETSAIFGMGRILNHHCLALNTIVANRIVKEFSSDGAAAVEKMIVKSLEIIADRIL